MTSCLSGSWLADFMIARFAGKMLCRGGNALWIMAVGDSCSPLCLETCGVAKASSGFGEYMAICATWFSLGDTKPRFLRFHGAFVQFQVCRLVDLVPLCGKELHCVCSLCKFCSTILVYRN